MCVRQRGEGEPGDKASYSQHCDILLSQEWTLDLNFKTDLTKQHIFFHSFLQVTAYNHAFNSADLYNH